MFHLTFGRVTDYARTRTVDSLFCVLGNKADIYIKRLYKIITNERKTLNKLLSFSQKKKKKHNIVSVWSILYMYLIENKINCLKTKRMVMHH